MEALLEKQAIGIDISVWQDNNSTPQMFDFTKARAMGASFCGIKVSQASWLDPDYILNWRRCRDQLYRMPYHFLVWDVPAKLQAETFWKAVEADPFGILPLTCDFEWWKTIPSNAFDVIYNFTYRLEQLCSPLPQQIYSAYYFWKQYGTRADYWKKFALWLCDIEGDVEVPLPWERWDFHQYTFKLPGPAWGAESLDLDGDRYNGTLAQMIARFALPELGFKSSGATSPDPKPEPEVITMYSEYPIGLVTDKANWTNTNFDFICGNAGGSWLEPNPELKPIETKAAGEKKPFLARWKFSVDFYTRYQVPMNLDLWTPAEKDEQLVMFKRALTSRDVKAVIVVVDDLRDHAGIEQAANYFSFAAKIFVERAEDWVRKVKGVPFFVATNNDFIEKKAPELNNWAHKYNSWITQSAKAPLVSSYPQATDKPAQISIRPTWECWQYSGNLVLFNKSRGTLASFLGIPAPEDPETPETPGTGTPSEYAAKKDLEALVAKVAALEAKLAQHTHSIGAPTY
jgi:GH25 family lysozyme M1 (1,4-beta-N-acetylmuramidase)